MPRIPLRARSRLRRRSLLAAVVLAATVGCRETRMALTPSAEATTGERGRLLARPDGTARSPAPTGLRPLDLGGKRDGVLYVPAHYRPDRPAPLLVFLHGAGGSARHSVGLLQKQADREGFLLLVPDSRGSTWDVILDDYGPDVAFLDRALAWTFERYAVDPAHVAIGGFSDGASYALSLGVTNGDLFDAIIAFSPGFVAPAARHGTPRIYVSHGTHDAVLPIDRCSRTLVPRLQRVGYGVRYHEFDGPHTVPQSIADEAVEWFLGSKRS